MEELLNKLKSLNAIRALGSYADYDPDDIHKDTIYFAEDLKKIYLNGDDYGGITTELYNELISQLDNKVEKIEGKHLSTEDFTTLLKQKLEGLTNYDDATLTAELNALKSRLDTLVGSGDVTAVIDTFQEIESFLQGITNTQTLTGLLQEMKEEIVALVNNNFIYNRRIQSDFNIDTDVPKSGGLFELKNPVGTFPFVTNWYKLFDFGTEDNGYCVQLLTSYTSDKPLYLRHKIGEESWTEWREILDTKTYKNLVFNGTSSQFLKADGSVDGTDYLPKSGGTMETNDGTSNKTVVLILNNDSSINTLCAEKFQLAGVDKGYVGYDTTYGSVIYNYVCRKILGIKDDGTPHFNGNKIWHEGNDGSGSGLDADLLDGKHAYEFSYNGYIGTNDLDSFNQGGLYQQTSNTNTTLDKNYPIIESGGLIAIPSTYSKTNQIYGTYSTNRWFARGSGNALNRTNWREFAFTDSNVASADKLTTKQLTNEDLNDIKDLNFTSYYALENNTCSNKPSSISGGFNLQVIRLNYQNISQILTSNAGGIYKRTFAAIGTWSSWQQLATTDGAVTKLTTKQLTNEDLNDIKDVNFNVYYGIFGNTCSNKPNNTGPFSLQCFRIGTGAFRQIFTNYDDNSIYTRNGDNTNNTWFPWKKMLTEDDVPKTWVGTEDEYNAITTKDANTIYYIKE